jgi:hypothetical protein
LTFIWLLLLVGHPIKTIFADFDPTGPFRHTSMICELWLIWTLFLLFVIVEQFFPHFSRLIVSHLGSVWIDLFEFIYWHKYLWDCLGEPSKFVISMFSFEVNWVIKVLRFCDIFENLFLNDRRSWLISSWNFSNAVC